jgi:hypothetical protein
MGQRELARGAYLVRRCTLGPSGSLELSRRAVRSGSLRRLGGRPGRRGRALRRNRCGGRERSDVPTIPASR